MEVKKITRDMLIIEESGYNYQAYLTEDAKEIIASEDPFDVDCDSLLLPEKTTLVLPGNTRWASIFGNASVWSEGNLWVDDDINITGDIRTTHGGEISCIDIACRKIDCQGDIDCRKLSCHHIECRGEIRSEF